MAKSLLNSSNPIYYTPPSKDEFEISVFGPGIGECLVIHLGDNQWIIVDSFIDALSKKPVSLSYFEKLGIDPSNVVKLIVVSHWHSDHIRGASQVYDACSNATICFSEALLKEEFLALTAAYSGLEQGKLLDRNTNATREIADIVYILRNRMQEGKLKQPYANATSDKRIRQINNKCEIWTLSPSSKSFLNSLAEIKSLMPDPSDDQIRKIIPAPDQNHNAIVLWIKFDERINVLLGSDLEETKDPYTGWSAIVNSSGRPVEKSKIFKVPHHGSLNAHSELVWTELLEKKPICLVTSKIGGRSDIPKPQDIRRLLSYSQDLYGTTYRLPKKRKYDRTVEKTIKGVVKRRVPLDMEPGHLQVRCSADEIKIGMNQVAKQYT